MKEEAWKTKPKNLDELWEACKTAFFAIPDDVSNKLYESLPNRMDAVLLLWADRLPRPHPQFPENPALKFVQTPHPQSAGMLISWLQSCGVYKAPPKADFSAELLLTQPAVNQVLWFRALALRKSYFSNCLLLFFPCVLPQPSPYVLQSGFWNSTTHLFPQQSSHGSTDPPVISHGSTVFLLSFHGPCIPRPSALEDSTVPPSPPTPHSPRSRSTFHSPVSRASQHLTPPENPESLPPVFVRGSPR